MIAPTFRLDDDGTAHVMLGAGLITARCGRNCRGPEVTTGRPCGRCIELATAAIVADVDPATDLATTDPTPAAAAVAALVADLGFAR